MTYNTHARPLRYAVSVRSAPGWDDIAPVFLRVRNVTRWTEYTRTEQILGFLQREAWVSIIFEIYLPETSAQKQLRARHATPDIDDDESVQSRPCKSPDCLLRPSPYPQAGYSTMTSHPASRPAPLIRPVRRTCLHDAYEM